MATMDCGLRNADFGFRNAHGRKGLRICLSVAFSLSRSHHHQIAKSANHQIIKSSNDPVSQSSAPVQETVGRESGWSFLLPRFYPYGVFAKVAISESRNKEQQTGNLTMIIFSIFYPSGMILH
jgi:hypothetical protein